MFIIAWPTILLGITGMFHPFTFKIFVNVPDENTAIARQRCV
jgi:hypothetical protein